MDFNYDVLIYQRQRVSKLMHVRSKYHALFSEANGNWSFFIDRLQELINKLHVLSQENAMDTDDTSFSVGVTERAGDLDEALSEIRDVNQSAIRVMYAGN